MPDTPIVPLVKAPQLIVKLEIVDEAGVPVASPFPLQEGGNPFWCMATYVDGSRSLFSPYWTCPIIYRSGGLDLWGVFGQQRRASVTVHASRRHERYTELACWVFEPSADHRNEMPFCGIGFDYSQIAAAD